MESRRCFALSSVLSAALALGADGKDSDSYGRGPRTAPSAPLHDRFAPCGSPVRAGVVTEGRIATLSDHAA